MDNIIIKEGVPTLEVNDASKVSEYVLIDVRTAEEFSAELGHIRGARLVPLGEDLDRFLSKADPAQSILFICRSGVRSAKATLQAAKLGFKNGLNMQGGMLSWVDKKFPVER